MCVLTEQLEARAYMVGFRDARQIKKCPHCGGEFLGGGKVIISEVGMNKKNVIIFLQQVIDYLTEDDVTLNPGSTFDLTVANGHSEVAEEEGFLKIELDGTRDFDLRMRLLTEDRRRR